MWLLIAANSSVKRLTNRSLVSHFRHSHYPVPGSAGESHQSATCNLSASVTSASVTSTSLKQVQTPRSWLPNSAR